MIDVFYTVDVEVWCDGWSDIDGRFPDAFQRYVYGRTSSGAFGLPYQLRLLTEHALTGVFFIEPLFAARFGVPALAEIVGLVKEAGHEVQLHMHTEWVDEAHASLLGPDSPSGKRRFMRQFSLDEQTRLIGIGCQLLQAAGATGVNAFRAGSFGLNADTLTAVARNGLRFDTSYNATQFGPDSGVAPGRLLLDTTPIADIHEYPMTVFRDGTGRSRHAQLGACAFGEIESALWQAAETERQSFVMLSHNFELMNLALDRADRIVVNRFRKLCAFLDKNRDTFRTSGFADLKPRRAETEEGLLTVPFWRTARRLAEQAWRRSYG
jgi:hypothetical protein